MDLKKRVDKIYYDMTLSKVKTEFKILSKNDELPELTKHTIQVLLIL